MLVDESKLCALLRRAYKHGYDILLGERRIGLKTEDWMVELEREFLPSKVLGTIVEHMRELPSAGTALTVHRGIDNQDIIWDVAVGDIQAFKSNERAREAKLLPLIWGGGLFQGEDLRIVAVSGGLLSVLERPEAGAMLLDGNRMMWAGPEGMAIFRAYHPAKGLEAERWEALEQINWQETEE